MPAPTPATLVGRSESHLCNAAAAAELGAPVHVAVVEPLRTLQAAAAAEGFGLTVLSGFRSFERQRSIWNRKAGGELAVLDNEARPLDVSTLSPRELALAILRWSALPGASRHHWGTDIDVYDARAKPEGYEVELVPAEVESGGMFAPLHEWLDTRIAEKTAFGFFRPYDRDRGGVAPERWHLSHAPLAREHASMLTPTLLRETLQATDMRLADVVLRDLEEIFERFVRNVAAGPS
ncbi:MAG: M15 family metallopeptidase [Gemmatimonadetes bacterium]|nr:M15 family metallopeptidase [Gemmatimonadota bacterium]